MSNLKTIIKVVLFGLSLLCVGYSNNLDFSFSSSSGKSDPDGIAGVMTGKQFNDDRAAIRKISIVNSLGDVGVPVYNVEKCFGNSFCFNIIFPFKKELTVKSYNELMVAQSQIYYYLFTRYAGQVSFVVVKVATMKKVDIDKHGYREIPHAVWVTSMGNIAYNREDITLENYKRVIPKLWRNEFIHPKFIKEIVNSRKHKMLTPVGRAG